MRPYLRRFAVAFLLLAVPVPAFPQIAVEGLADKTIYPDGVTFRIPTSVGYDYVATLHGEPVPVEGAVPVGVSVTVEDPKQYYELLVERTLISSGAKESLTLQFIVRATERAETEQGIPPWTPYPPTTSAAAEFAGANLVLVTPAAFPAGLEIPVATLVRDGTEKRVGVNGFVSTAAFPGTSIRILRGVGSGYLPAAPSGGSVTYDATIGGVSASKTIAIDASTSWTPVSGTIAASTEWGPNARIHVTGGLTVADGATLAIRAGTIVRVAPDAEVEVTGNLEITGSLDAPVVFTADERARPWGGFLLRASTSRAIIQGGIFVRSGADPRWFDNNANSGYSHRHEQALFYLSGGARIDLADSFLFDGAGQAAHGENSDFDFRRCLVQRFTTTGQFNGGTISFTDSAFVEFPALDARFADADNDAMYLGPGTRTLTNCLIGWTLDDGTDGGGGATGPMFINGCWFEATYHEGFALTDDGDRTFRDSVAINCGQGFECGYDSTQGDVERCLVTANGVGLRFCDNYDWDYNGFLSVTNSFSLFNWKDVWARGWDTWQHHLSQMDIEGNYLSLADPLYPNNTVWNPAGDADHLLPFLPSPATTVGAAIALWSIDDDIARIADGIPVRLSTFTNVPVTVGYRVTGDEGLSEAGTLDFPPGESIRTIRVADPTLADRSWVRVQIEEGTNSELTGLSEILYTRYSYATLVPKGANWKYWDAGSLPGATWNLSNFDDTAWPSGNAELGEGDGGEETPIALGPSGNRYTGFYFRTRFEVESPDEVVALNVQLLRDDGAVVYLNGSEVLRQNMPEGPVGYATLSAAVVDGSDETTWFPGSIDPASLVTGTNVLAVEVHQSTLTSSDVSFDLEIVAKSRTLAAPVFLRGDANADATVDISDAVTVLLYLFLGSQVSCPDALDVNDDGVLNITDPIFLLDFLFRGVGSIPEPYPNPDADPSPDDLNCAG